jgi:hypothetical protein
VCRSGRIVECRIVALSSGETQHGGLEPGETRFDTSQEGSHVVERVHADEPGGRSGEVTAFIEA